MAYNLDQSYTTGQDNNDGSLVGGLRLAANNSLIWGMSFTPTLSGPLNRFELYIKKIGTPTGNIWGEIRVDGADPSSSTQLGSNSPNIDVSTPTIALTPGTKYWFLINGDYTLSTSNFIMTGQDTSSPSYSGGNSGRYGNGGAAWEDVPTSDNLFQQYSDDAPSGGFIFISS